MSALGKHKDKWTLVAVNEVMTIPTSRQRRLQGRPLVQESDSRAPRGTWEIYLCSGSTALSSGKQDNQVYLLEKPEGAILGGHTVF